jgi:short-chain fatty acids transporter
MRLAARVFSRIAERYLPDAFIFLVALTLLVMVLGLFEGSSPREVIDFWGAGFFEILEFTMQSTLVLVTGFALANTPPVHRALRAFAHVPSSTTQIVVITVLVVMACDWISWGFGLIAGAIVAREMGIVHRGKVHYPLVVAAAYAAFVVWHAGYSGAIPTLIATKGHFLEDQMGVIPVSETIFAPSTYLIVFALAVVIPITMVRMHPKRDEPWVSLPDSVLSEEEDLMASQGERGDDGARGPRRTGDDGAGGGRSDAEPASGGVAVLEADSPAAERSEVRPPPGVTPAPALDTTPALRLERHRAVTLVFGLLGLAYLVSYFAGGGALDINIVIFTFVVAGLLLIRNTRDYLTQLAGGARAASGIIIQFPFYGAIMGIMVGTGLVKTIADFFVGIASAETLPFFAFLSGGIINMFVPSGGGQWAVQGPIMVDAAKQLGADMPKVAMGVAWGDAWTNMIQPFWTLPLLAVAGLGIRDIMGYTAVVLLTTGVVIGAGLLLL